jgi:hypothetical protein
MSWIEAAEPTLQKRRDSLIHAASPALVEAGVVFKDIFTE